jgi:hypothetical protein
MRWTRWLAVLPGILACSIPRVSRGGLERFWEPRFFLPWNRLTGLGDSMATGFQNRPGIRAPILLVPFTGGPSTPGAGHRRFQAAAQRSEPAYLSPCAG